MQSVLAFPALKCIPEPTQKGFIFSRPTSRKSLSLLA